MRTYDHDGIADALVAQMRECLLASFEALAARFEADIRAQVRCVDWGDTITNESDAPDVTWAPY